MVDIVKYKKKVLCFSILKIFSDMFYLKTKKNEEYENILKIDTANKSTASYIFHNKNVT